MSPETRESFTRIRSVASLDAVAGRLDALSSGDRIIFYILAALVAATSLLGLYALEQSLLVTVPAYGGTLVEGGVGSPRFINPLLAISDADRDLAALTYAGLMGLSGTGELMPVLSEGYTLSENGKVYTFTLRQDARFSDGTSVSAEDVVYTVERAQDPALKSPRYADWSGVRVEAVDERTVRFTLAKPYAPFLELTTLGILPAHLWREVTSEEFPFSTRQTSPVGAGPFTVERLSRDASGLIESVTLVANPYYPLGRPYLNSIRFVFYPRTEDLVNALRHGEIESAYDVGTEGALTAPYARVFGVFYNPTEKQVFARPEVRKALSLALDREAMVSTVLGDFATPIIGPVPPGGSVTPTPVPLFEDPVKEAADVLSTAGWKYDGTARLWSHAGTKQTLESVTLRTSNVPELKSIASAVKVDWEKLGIPVSIELYEPGDLSQNVIRPRRYETLLYGMVIGRDQDLYAFWDSGERNDPGLNIALYANKTVDTLLEDARGSLDKASRVRNLQKIEEAIAADYPAAFLYAPDFTYALPEDLQGVALPQIIVPSDRFATAALWYRTTDRVWPFFTRESL